MSKVQKGGTVDLRLGGASSCEVCTERDNLVAEQIRSKQGITCQKCQKDLPVAQLFDGSYAARRGYDSLTPDHYHEKIGSQNGAPNVTRVAAELCLDCYRGEFRAAYPDKPLPV